MVICRGKKEMTKEKKERKGNSIKIFGMLLSSIPIFTIRFGRIYLRFKRQSKKAGKIFRKKLIKEGIDKNTAGFLTDQYLSSSDIRQYITH